jgi:hypothetical protein
VLLLNLRRGGSVGMRPASFRSGAVILVAVSNNVPSGHYLTAVSTPRQRLLWFPASEIRGRGLSLLRGATREKV